MTLRLRWLVPLVAAPLVPLAVAAPAAQAAAPAPAPAAESGLVVDIVSVTPAALQQGEPLGLSAHLTNTRDRPWRDVQAYLVVSATPLGSRADLDAAAQSPPDTYFGDRITATDTFADDETFPELRRLEPGEQVSFDVEVPWRSLPDAVTAGTEGVYTVGLQVLGTDTDGNRGDVLARARTFVPLVDDTGAQQPARVDLAQVWSLRAPVLRRADGTYVGGAGLRSSMDPGGRLRRLVDLAETAGDVPVSVVSDPALLDAADDIAGGTFGPPPPRGGPADGEDPGATPDEAAEDDAADGAVGEEAPTARDNRAVQSPSAQAWLQDVADVSERFGLVTEYGEADVAVEAEAPRLRAAVRRTTTTTSRRLLGRVPGTAMFAEQGVGAATLAAVGDSPGEPLVVVSPDQLPDWRPGDAPVVEVPVGEETVTALVADPTLVAGGPVTVPPADEDDTEDDTEDGAEDDTDEQPADEVADETAAEPTSALQVRQRLLAETALLSLAASAQGRQQTAAVFVPSARWDPGLGWSSADFFSDLPAAWLRPVPLADLRADATSYTGEVADLSAADSEAESDGEAPDALLAADLATAAAKVNRQAHTLVQLVSEEGRRDRRLVRWYDAAAALGVSSYRGQDGERRLAATRATALSLSRQLDQVSLEGSSFVTLSSSRGRFGVTITNGLERPVTVGVRVDAESAGLEFDAGDPVTVPPGQRQTVTVDTRVGEDNRVTRARVVLVTGRGDRVGKPLDFSLRTSVVGTVIWVVVGIAAAILLVAIVRRVVRRVRRVGAAPGR